MRGWLARGDLVAFLPVNLLRPNLSRGAFFLVLNTIYYLLYTKHSSPCLILNLFEKIET